MTVWAFVSDVHGRGDRLARVLSAIRAHAADRIVGLGDIAGASSLALLSQVNATCVFGNWEASGLRGLPAPYRGWVARWPPRLQLGDFFAAHATPVWPAGLPIGGVVDYLRVHSMRWTELFPSLMRSEEARWAAFAELEAAGVPILFHGHTHVQEAWCWKAGEAPRRFGGDQPELYIGEGERWLIGVGSVGEPHDGNGASYALYDDAARKMEWRRA